MKNQMESGENATILELLSSEDEMLLIRRNALLVVFTVLLIVSQASTSDLESNGLASKDLDEYLHTAAKMKNEMKSGFFLDVVVGLAFKIKLSLTLVVPDLRLDFVDGI